MNGKLAGGFDGGAHLVDGAIRRIPGPWTPAVNALLQHLASTGFVGAPRSLGSDAQGRDVLSYLDGSTVGNLRPWPRWTHSDGALLDVGDWLRRYHSAVADFVPPAGSRWREGRAWKPGLIIGHNDAAPYNAVWNAHGLVGFVDWDMAGPTTSAEDLAWVVFSWVPLHARQLVVDEGFTAFGERRARLESILRVYGWGGTTDDVLELIRRRVQTQRDIIRSVASSGDETYRRMLAHGVDLTLQSALGELDTV
ncbi:MULTISPECIES: phosphotransferase [unclassified Cryobacterium]|uniref:phosphotransferase n=1 Tax=unclassified Cryobacterium TaxID=2649013 RepID=UPI00106A362B|nr:MULTISPECIES: phosphotransferase [unclassified Cryobacterium]TFC58019.1 aminoglycoside phosphotransferase family protein [Cryobacterium sp. TMB3-1-2]TFC67847.1 aminoglycoside phosphotransferase family protein [Cryobacterium sp. TMB3-15]TFC76766.1 aminoglycoside phosphotransferase family protein [Cryobacterium sp. TMB3-10]TFD39986.1 aminoglycoside phosphotransferase family protein [Cryobacterium sp. TMB3-12]